jgi:dTDP-glucose pyrophosphorylase
MIVGSVLDRVMMSSKSSIREAMRIIDNGAMQLALAVDSSGVLLGVITDGDVRRGLLDGLSLDSPVDSIMNVKPVVVRQADGLTQILELMKRYDIEHIPVLDINGKLTGLHVRNENKNISRDNLFVIMAGGLGSRLLPYTKDCPKPMLLVKGKPILEKIIARAKRQGFHNFLISVNYLSHVIQDYFGDGSKFDVSISYIEEKDRLGTIGALSLCKSKLRSSFIVTNGDVLTDINYEYLLNFHDRNEFVGTMAVKAHKIQNPYGVVYIDGHTLVGFEEKPLYHSYINTGVYVLSPSALSFLKENEYCDAPTLFDRIAKQYPAKSAAYVIEDEWLDIGRPEDFHSANNQSHSHYSYD